MKLNYLISAVLLFFMFAVPSVFSADEKGRLAELDALWDEISRSVREGDFEAYKATCHKDGVLVSGSSRSCYPLSKALARWEKDFINTRSGKVKGNVEFRFSQRLGDETTALETGIFLYTSTKADASVLKEYINFEILLLKQEEGWKVMMEYQKSRTTQEEWEQLK